MTHKDEGELFASFAEDHREFGFQRDLMKASQRSSRKPWLAVCAILLIAVGGFVAINSSHIGQDHVTTTALH
jgi:hypothetical protein